MRARPSLLVLALCLVAATAPSADAHVGKRQGLIFQDARPLSLKWHQVEGNGFKARVCNIDRYPANGVQAALTGFPDEAADWSDPGAPQSIDSGGCPSLLIKTKLGTPPDPG